MKKGQTEAPTKTGAKSKAKLNKKNLDAKTEAAAVAKAVKNRELKYIYPADITGPLERKAFRQGIRAKIKSFEKRIEKFDGTAKDKKSLVKEFNSFSSTVLA